MKKLLNEFLAEAIDENYECYAWHYIHCRNTKVAFYRCFNLITEKYLTSEDADLRLEAYEKFGFPESAEYDTCEKIRNRYKWLMGNYKIKE
jgi:hypothetical protein